MSRIIGLSGPAGVGKTTVAEALGALGFERVPLARPLKAMLGALYRGAGLDAAAIAARLDGAQKEAADPVLLGATPRWAMQSLGTEWGRACVHGDLWVSIWTAAAMRAIADGAPGVVADDVRFANEAAAIRRLGGLVVGLSRTGVVARGGHESEAGVACDVSLCIDEASPEAVAAHLRGLCPVVSSLGSVRRAPEDRG